MGLESGPGRQRQRRTLSMSMGHPLFARCDTGIGLLNVLAWRFLTAQVSKRRRSSSFSARERAYPICDIGGWRGVLRPL